jgi:hypothetical protein
MRTAPAIWPLLAGSASASDLPPSRTSGTAGPTSERRDWSCAGQPLRPVSPQASTALCLRQANRPCPRRNHPCRHVELNALSDQPRSALKPASSPSRPTALPSSATAIPSFSSPRSKAPPSPAATSSPSPSIIGRKSTPPASFPAASSNGRADRPPRRSSPPASSTAPSGPSFPRPT